ncbi:cytochrome c-type biogenesis protein [Marinobacterium marinum]|uniref:Cytochrome c-type biogenesis protein n=1 Tax=Marinobacterium marinum TaxID=2756129 RepID=A0A7W2ABG2_9GAMM|nr:cytochrome c-type biogenesis protein [Marinobacterium marinum]MBA4501028.1 cytochrome c-type biogenesis protein CcmH [Marinobacterium marinum]
MRFWLLLALVWLPLTAQATIDAYEFSSEENEQRFHELTNVLRCPKCQNQNISDSDAPLAADLRREVYRMLEEGEANDGIIDFMVTRYGEFVLYRPKVNATTWLLWYGPFVLLAIGLIVVVLISRNRRRQQTAAPASGAEVNSAESSGRYQASAELSADESARLNKLLQQDSDQ